MIHQTRILHLVDHSKWWLIAEALRVLNDLFQASMYQKQRKPLSLNDHLAKRGVDRQGNGDSAVALAYVAKSSDTSRPAIYFDQPVVNHMPGAMFLIESGASSHTRDVVSVLRKEPRV